MQKVNLLTALTILSFVSSAQAIEVAKVNGKVITDRDIQVSIGGFNETQKKKILGDLNYRTEIVNNLVEQELLLQDAEKQGLDQDQGYKDALSLFRRQYLTERALQKKVTAKITESSARAYYEGNARRYMTDRIKVQHILVPELKEANEIVSQVKSGQDFQGIAERRSRDPSAAANRGDVGYITWESPFADEFKEAAFSTKKGEVTGPVKTLAGYHIIKVVDKLPGRRLEFPEIELRVKGDLRKELARSYLSELRRASKVAVDEKAIEKIR
jgi:peptidyl-prolyl cis-trans isomerase C